MKKAKVEEKKDLQHKKLYKSFQSEIKTETSDGRRVVVAQITTPSTDRSKDHVNPKGIDTTNFMKNPVVLFAHKYDELPVAKCTGLKASDSGILATVEFPEEGRYEKSDLIYWMCQNNYLSATSIGFMPDDYEVNKDGGCDFKTSELFEFSFVPVPDQPEALLVMRSKGIDVAKALNDMRGKELPEGFDVEKALPAEEEEIEGKEKEAIEVTVKIGDTEEVIKTLDEGKTLIERLAAENEALKKEVATHKEADNPSSDLPISGLTLGQLKDFLAEWKVGKDVDKSEKNVDNEAKNGEGTVKKDVQEVLMLSDVLSCLSWVIWCFENDMDGDTNQASIEKLNQALAMILQVVQNEAVMSEKSFKLSDIPKGKEFIKILVKAGRTISGKHEEMLKDSMDHMTKAIDSVQNVLNTVTPTEGENDGDEDTDKSVADDELYLTIAAPAIKEVEEVAEDEEEDFYAQYTLRGGETN